MIVFVILGVLLVIAAILGILFFSVGYLIWLVTLFMSPFNKKAEKFHNEHFKSGPWIWW